MIYFISLLCSLCIQFVAIDFPINYYDVNLLFESSVNSAINSINSRGFNLDKEYVILCNRNNGAAPYAVFYPMELIDSSYSSSLTAVGRSSSSINITSYNYVRFLLDSSYGVASGPSSPAYASSYITNISTVGYYDIETQTTTSTENILYNARYPLPFNRVDTFSFYNSPPVLDLGGHATGWSDLLQEDAQGNIYTVLGHSNGTLDNSNTIDLVTSSSDLTDKLLTVLINLTSGMNDNISFGLGSLISLFKQGLNVVGLDGIATKLDNLFNKVEDGVDTTNDYIAWVSEPFDAGEFDIAVQNSGFGNFSALAHTIQTTLDAARTDNTHVYLTLDLSNVRYFSGFGSRTYDLATYLNGSKSIWQPLLLTFIYASVFWGFFRSIPNIVGGASPIVNSVSGGGKNA